MISAGAELLIESHREGAKWECWAKGCHLRFDRAIDRVAHGCQFGHYGENFRELMEVAKIERDANG
jgi:hypothetical protein